MRVIATVSFYLSLIVALASPTHAGPREDAAEARGNFSAGMKALDSGSPLEASEAFAKAARMAPGWGLAFLQWGIAEQLYNPESKDVLTALERAAALSPGNARAHYHLALAYQRAGDNRKAIREFDRTLEQREDYPGARFELARALWRDRNASRAIEELRAVLRDKPRHTGAITTLAEIYEASDRADDAESMWVRITQVQPHVAFNFVRLAHFYERRGESRKAEQARAQAEALDPRPKRRLRQLR